MTVFYYIIGAVLTLAPLIAGIVIKFYPPKKINKFYGFKTKTTAQNQQNMGLCPQSLRQYIIAIFYFWRCCLCNRAYTSHCLNQTKGVYDVLFGIDISDFGGVNCFWHYPDENQKI